MRDVGATAIAQQRDGPPSFVRLAAHPVRWRLLRELVVSDRAVRELTALVGERQSLVSYHLGHLRAGGLVRSHRSAADGRDSYYSVDLAGCREQLRAAGGALHPGLRPAATPMPGADTVDAPDRRPRVLFLCTGNSARSQMAEALLTSMSQGTVAATSAGSHPKPLHPVAVQVMAARGIDISTRRPKPVGELVADHVDVVVTLCDRVREVCPSFPSHPDLVHWSVPDPAAAGPDEGAVREAFERTATELAVRIEFLMATLQHRPTRGSPHA